MNPTRPATGAHRTDKWYAFDASNERLSLFSMAAIGGFGLVVALGLYLIYPQRGLENQIERSTRSDPLTVEYLKAFLAAQPDSPRLRLLLARQQMRLGRHDEARAVLRPFATAPMDAARVEAELYEFDLREREAFALPPGSEQREAATRAAGLQLARLAGLPLSAAQVEYLARRALAIGEKTAAVDLYRRIAAAGPRSPSASAEAAELVLGLGDYVVAAQLYFRAQERALMPARKREYYMAGVRTLMAGNLYDRAIAEADRNLGALADDVETLKFLARTAQAANRADAAQRYAKRLLRMALLERLRDALDRQGVMLAYAPQSIVRAQWIATPDRKPVGIVRVAGEGRGPGIPFDDEAYVLGFNIFLAAGNLADAFRVAESAVAQAPRSAEWRKRLAQVAEWRGAPQVALAHWLAHARLSGEEASWDASLRLAKGLYDDSALLAVLNHRFEREPGSHALVEDIVGVHERLGDPDAAIAFLEAQARGAQRRVILERLAALAERAGRDSLAFDTWLTLQREFGPSLGYANRIAARYYLTGDLRAAFGALEAVLARAQTTDTAYWQMYAELARLLQMDQKAIAGYRRLLESEQYSEDDLANLAALLDQMRPDQAARVAEFAFGRFGRAALALQVIYQYTRAADRAAIARFLAALPETTRAELERDARFLAARAAHHQASGSLRAALADWIAADALEPRNPDTQAAIVWTLIALRDAPALNRALTSFAAGAEREARLWGAFAAANMSLNRQAEALRWFRKQADRKSDYLWLMAYAECLDANAQPEVAWRIRRKVWTELRRPEVLASLPAGELVSMRDRLAALVLVFVPGDRAKALVESLLQADLEELRKSAPASSLPATGAELAVALEQAANSAPLASAATARGLPEGWFTRADAAPPARFPVADNDATVKELALGWALNSDAQELARAWLITRYADSLARPLWGELAVALAASDGETLTRLLDDLPDWLPMYDRIEAAMRVGRPGLAQTLAFGQLDHLQFDEELHARFTGMAVADPALVGGAVTGIRPSPLAIAQTRAGASADLTPRLKLGLTLTLNRQSTMDQTALVNVPQTDATAAAFLRYRGERGALTATLAHRSAMREINALRLDYDLALVPRVRLAGSAGINQLATEQVVLRVGAMKDTIENNLTWAISNREYLRAGLAWNRYYSQSGAGLGRGTLYNLEAGHRVRVEYPDLAVRMFATRANFSASPTDDPLLATLLPPGLAAGENVYLPSSYTEWGVAAGFGMSLVDRYTRALRPFLDFTLFHNSQTGAGHAVRLGMAGSLAGQDHAAIYFSQSTGTPGAPQGMREFGLTYKWFY